MISLVREALDDQRSGMMDCHISGRSPKEIIAKLGKSRKSKRFKYDEASLQNESA